LNELTCCSGADGTRCPDGWHGPYNSSCYYVSPKDVSVSQSDGRSACLGLGAELTSIVDQSELKYIINISYVLRYAANLNALILIYFNLVTSRWSVLVGAHSARTVKLKLFMRLQEITRLHDCEANTNKYHVNNSKQYVVADINKEPNVNYSRLLKAFCHNSVDRLHRSVTQSI